MENTNTTEAPGDGEILDELLLDLDAFTGMIERAHQAARKGKATVRLIPRGKERTIAEALDELGDALTRTTLAVRAQRALRDGEASTPTDEPTE